jgi:hypothetical protein
MYSKVGREFELGHFFDLQPADDSHDLEETFLAALDWLLDAEGLILDPAFNVGLELVDEGFEEIAVALALDKEVIVLGGDFLEGAHEETVELLFEIIVGDGADVVREDHVGTPQTHVSHQLQELVQKFSSFDLFLVEPTSQTDEFP